jgi:hypothetical protein
MNFLRARFIFLPFMALVVSCATSPSAFAQSSRFTLRAEPDVIAANGISTTSIFVQLPQGRGAIEAAPLVRFATTAGVIETQAQLTGGVARVLLRSSTTPGTAIVTAFIGNSREAITVEFSEENGLARRYLEVAAPYVAYGADRSQITASGKTSLDFGDTHIESDVRLDIDLGNERVWAQGTKGSVSIRQGRGAKAKTLRGDRLFYDLRRKRGVMRRAEGLESGQLPRQEFVGNDFAPPVPDAASEEQNRVSPQNQSDNEIVAPVVKPPLAPSPSLALETEENRGSALVPAPAPPTAPEEAEREGAPTIVAPRALEGAKTDESELKTAAPAVQSNEKASKPTQFGDLGAQLNASGQNSPSTPDSLAASPAEMGAAESRVTALVTVPRAGGEAGNLENPNPPAYKSLPSDSGPSPRIVELPPPTIDTARGYWVASRRLRVFPRDKVQFERAAVFFNGQKAFGMPLYVLPLDGSFNPATDLLSFNSQGGLSIKAPLTYQASPRGTGTIFLKREPGSGFSTQRAGFSLAIEQQYWLSPRSHGQLSLDQIGRGAYNVNFQHQTQFSPDTSGSFFLNMPRHRDVFARASLSKELKAMQIGFEAFYDRPETQDANLRGQFFARMRPKAVGKTGWSYTLGANALAVKRGITRTITVGGGSGGGVGVPGQNGPPAGRTFTTTRPLVGQTLTAALQSPFYSPWRGAGVSANLLATAFNYSDGRRGVAPGITLGVSQKLGSADLRIDYTYDRSNLGLYGVTGESFTNYLSGNLTAQLSKKIGVSTFISRSLSDDSTYGSADLDYFFAPKWRAGIFTDYSAFAGTDSLLNYGWSVGRALGSREVSLNFDANRGRVYVELGNARY